MNEADYNRCRCEGCRQYRIDIVKAKVEWGLWAAWNACYNPPKDLPDCLSQWELDDPTHCPKRIYGVWANHKE